MIAVDGATPKCFAAERRDCPPLTTNGSRAEHLERDLLVRYVHQLRENRRTATVIMRLTGLASAVRVMAPTADIAWLQSLIRRLHRDWDDRRPKLLRIRASSELFKLGIGLMHEAEAETILRPTMTVEAVDHHEGVNTVHCAWFDDKKQLQRHTFLMDVVEKS